MTTTVAVVYIESQKRGLLWDFACTKASIILCTPKISGEWSEIPFTGVDAWPQRS